MNQTTTSAIAIMAALRDEEVAPPATIIEEVAETASAPCPDTAVQSERRRAKRDLWRRALLAKGIAPEVADDLAVKREVVGSGQRALPRYATACDPAVISFFAERTDEQIEGDLLKLIRNDGGKAGPEARYAELIGQAGSTARGAMYVADHVAQRIGSIRVYAACCINELRRRRAERAGIDPKSISYLKVKIASGVTVMGAASVDTLIAITATATAAATTDTADVTVVASTTETEPTATETGNVTAPDVTENETDANLITDTNSNNNQYGALNDHV